MKKFCDKFTKQQWRVTVPNISTTIFKKSPSKSRDDVSDNQMVKKKHYGSYDLQTAALEFEKTKSVVGSVIFDSASIVSDSDSYQDAIETSEKLGSVDDLDSSLYADVDTSIKSETSRCPSDCNEKFECDVPKISFSFFDEQDNHEYQLVKVKHKVDSKSENLDHDVPDSGVLEETYTNVEEKPRYVSKAKIMLAMSTPKSDEPDEVLKFSKSANDIDKVGHKMLTLSKKEGGRKLSSDLVKSNSDPNLSNSQIDLDEGDDGLYKVPGPARRYGYSHSLVDLNKNIEFVSSAHSSIEHISCSQVFAAKVLAESSMESSEKEDKILQIKRKIALLKKPKSKTLLNLKTKLNNMMMEQAATQRVGYFSEKEPTGARIEEMYKTSKDKCKKMLKSTGKFFTKPKKDQENVNPNCVNGGSSVIIKNDAFFAQVPKRFNAGDIEHKVNSEDCPVSENLNSDNIKSDKCENKAVTFGTKMRLGLSLGSNEEDKNSEGDSQLMRYTFKRSKSAPEIPSGFEDLRKYVKQGGDFCKELSTILQERSDAELQYAKHLQKLSVKLARACREGVGGLSDAWCSVANELEGQAEAHRVLGNALLEDTVRPLKNLNDNQHKIRKQAEIIVDKASKVLGDWRITEAKSKKNSHACARDNEKLQDALLDVRLPKSAGLIQLAHAQNQKVVSDKENAKMEGKRRKAEDAVKKSDAEYYNLCVRTERARLDWESAVLRGSTTFQILEEERLSNLKSTLNSYLHHVRELGPKLIDSTDRLALPVAQSDPNKDLMAFMSLRNSSQQVAEQLLPDFYCEHITLAMNRERRKQALTKLLQLIRQDIERERKSKLGLENLSRAMKETPSFGAEESQQNVLEKLYHMKSMLTYLEGARYKVQSALAELDSRPKSGHPLAPHIIITRDKSGLQQSILKVPQWLRDEWIEPERSPMSEKSTKSHNMSEIIESDWMDRGAADGNSNQPDSDFDEFSSQGSSSGGMCTMEENPLHPIAFCKSLYDYTPNLPDELTLHVGDVISVYRKQDDGWWIGECNGSVGIFPATYVEALKN